MPIIIVCGDEKKIDIFCHDIQSELDQNVKIHRTPFSEAISDVIEDDTSVNHIITRSFYKPDRYITFCHSKRFKTSYLVVFLAGEKINSELEIPRETTRHDNPLIISDDYEREDKKIFFENLKSTLANKIIKKSYSNQKIIKDQDFLQKAHNIIKKVQNQYHSNLYEDIFIETENRMMSILSNNRIKLNEIEECYSEILKNAMNERGFT